MRAAGHVVEAVGQVAVEAAGEDGGAAAGGQVDGGVAAVAQVEDVAASGQVDEDIYASLVNLCHGPPYPSRATTAALETRFERGASLSRRQLRQVRP